MKSSNIESIEVKSAFTLKSLRIEADGREYYSLGRLNDHMHPFMTDGQYTVDMEEEKLLKKHKLDGNGLVIGVADSGMDSSFPVFDNDLLVKMDQSSLNLNHRKIMCYKNMGIITDMKDRSHGTHVVGMITGKENNENMTKYNVVVTIGTDQ